MAPESCGRTQAPECPQAAVTRCPHPSFEAVLRACRQSAPCDATIAETRGGRRGPLDAFLLLRLLIRMSAQPDAARQHEHASPELARKAELAQHDRCHTIHIHR